MQAAVAALDRVPVAQGYQFRTGRQDLPGVQDVGLIRREGRIHHDQVNVRYIGRMHLQKVGVAVGWRGVADAGQDALQLGLRFAPHHLGGATVKAFADQVAATGTGLQERLSP